jgi:hypothetical protein
LVIGCLLVGNLAGYVFTSVADFGGMDYQKPGGVVLAAVQSAFGCALSFWASFKVLGDESYANPCIVFLVVVSALLALLTVVGAFLFGEIEEYLTWDFASSVAGVAALEVTRRVVKNEVWT